MDSSSGYRRLNRPGKKDAGKAKKLAKAFYTIFSVTTSPRTDSKLATTVFPSVTPSHRTAPLLASKGYCKKPKSDLHVPDAPASIVPLGIWRGPLHSDVVMGDDASVLTTTNRIHVLQPICFLCIRTFLFLSADISLQ